MDQGKVYRGRRSETGDAVVTVDGEPLTPERSTGHIRLSSYGFEWGFEGVGPGQLALALLLDATDNVPLSLRLWAKFKRDHVCRFAKMTWMMTQTEVRDWASTNA